MGTKLRDKYDPESLQCDTFYKISEYIERDFSKKTAEDLSVSDNLFKEVKNWVLNAHLCGKIKIKDPVALSIQTYKQMSNTCSLDDFRIKRCSMDFIKKGAIRVRKIGGEVIQLQFSDDFDAE